MIHNPSNVQSCSTILSTKQGPISQVVSFVPKGGVGVPLFRGGNWFCSRCGCLGVLFISLFFLEARRTYYCSHSVCCLAPTKQNPPPRGHHWHPSASQAQATVHELSHQKMRKKTFEKGATRAALLCFGASENAFSAWKRKSTHSRARGKIEHGFSDTLNLKLSLQHAHVS